MRLIDADALKKTLDEQMNFEENCRDSVFGIIDNAPTVEPICPYLSDDEVKQPCLQAPCKKPPVVDSCDMNLFEPEKYMRGEKK